METILTLPSEKGTQEWEVFNVVRVDKIDAYPVAGVRAKWYTEQKPLLVGEPRFAH